jgi:hypothetical protein
MGRSRAGDSLQGIGGSGRSGSWKRRRGLIQDAGRDRGAADTQTKSGFTYASRVACCNLSLVRLLISDIDMHSRTVRTWELLMESLLYLIERFRIRTRHQPLDVFPILRFQSPLQSTKDRRSDCTLYSSMRISIELGMMRSTLAFLTLDISESFSKTEKLSLANAT